MARIGFVRLCVAVMQKKKEEEEEEGEELVTRSEIFHICSKKNKWQTLPICSGFVTFKKEKVNDKEKKKREEKRRLLD